MSGIISANVGRASGLLKAGAAGGLIGYAYSNNGSETAIASLTLVSTGLYVAYTPTNYSANKIIVTCQGHYSQDGANSELGYYQINCTGQHTTNFALTHSSIDNYHGHNAFSISFNMQDTNLVNNTGAQTYTLWAKTNNASSTWRPHANLTMSVMEIGL